jgi:ubiquinol-cytochrome c reductase cytochrome c subunit
VIRRARVAGAILALLAGPAAAHATAPSSGATLYGEHCGSCHGFAGRGMPARGPSLRGVGAAAADFYLTTGRMPLAHPRDVPVRRKPAFRPGEIDALVAYVATLGGPAIPRPDPARGDLAEGMQAFTANCAGCHQIAGRGGILPTTGSPALLAATPTQIAEAVRIGPYLMPRFSRGELPDRQLDSVIRYVQSLRSPDDEGGLGLGNTGPVPEGAVAWLVGACSLVVVARVLGKARP